MSALGRGGIFQFEGFRLDRNAGALFRRRDDATFVPIVLGLRAFDVLDVLVGRAGELVSRDEFMAAVWPATVVEDSNLNMQIAALRRVLDEGRADGSCIQTIPGRGYRFTAPVMRVAADASSLQPSGHRAVHLNVIGEAYFFSRRFDEAAATLHASRSGVDLSCDLPRPRGLVARIRAGSTMHERLSAGFA